MNGMEKKTKRVIVTFELDVYTDKKKIGVSDINVNLVCSAVNFSIGNGPYTRLVDRSNVTYAKVRVNNQYEFHSRITFSDETAISVWHNYKNEEWLRKKYAVYGYCPDGNHATITKIERLN